MAIYTNDHRPPHVHAIKPGGARAKIDLNCPDGLVRLVGQNGFRLNEIVEIGSAVAAKLETICAEWRRIHG